MATLAKPLEAAEYQPLRIRDWARRNVMLTPKVKAQLGVLLGFENPRRAEDIFRQLESRLREFYVARVELDKKPVHLSRQVATIVKALGSLTLVIDSLNNFSTATLPALGVEFFHSSGIQNFVHDSGIIKERLEVELRRIKKERRPRGGRSSTKAERIVVEKVTSLFLERQIWKADFGTKHDDRTIRKKLESFLQMALAVIGVKLGTPHRRAILKFYAQWKSRKSGELRSQVRRSWMR